MFMVYFTYNSSMRWRSASSTRSLRNRRPSPLAYPTNRFQQYSPHWRYICSARVKS